MITDGKDTGMGIFKSADAMQELRTSIPIARWGLGIMLMQMISENGGIIGGSAKITQCA